MIKWIRTSRLSIKNSVSQVEAAAREANATEFIDKLPEGFQTVVSQVSSDLRALPESHGLNLAFAVLSVPNSFDSGRQGLPDRRVPGPSLSLSSLELSDTKVYEP